MRNNKSCQVSINFDGTFIHMKLIIMFQREVVLEEFLVRLQMLMKGLSQRFGHRNNVEGHIILISACFFLKNLSSY